AGRQKQVLRKRWPGNLPSERGGPARDSGLSTAGYKTISFGFHESAIVQGFTVIGLLARSL
ncbi:MAG TPA: hypothetical protein VFV61_02745, partial [Pyrinomonadaceae bacterium]|nr:hypothetical protein [Pyrinomonadaceae bacterium]